MDASVLGAAVEALFIILDPFRLTMLCVGILTGLFLGIIPGIGGLAGMALLLPFTFTMDSYSAFAMLLGMAAVTGTSDTIPAVLFGVPGSTGSQATVMDGSPMAKKGEAGRALSAAYMASLIGGLVGAVILAFTIPVLRPVMLFIASPEMLMLSIFGISMVAVLAGSSPLRGLIAAGLGILLSMIGADSQSGTLRWTMDTFYLWDGLSIVPLVLGLFALPELADLAIKRSAITNEVKYDTRKGMLQGVKDVFQNWWLTVRCGGLGAAIGAIPGVGSEVIDWIAYGHAAQTEKGARETFGKGDVRGVIAPESANNSIKAGSLVPTIAFGVPGSASMAILLGVFLMHGLIPGPDMLTIHLDVTYSMVWSIAIANIVGAGLCFAFSGQLAKVATLRYTLILPLVIVFVFVGAFQSNRSWGDLYSLLIFAVLGWTMKQLKWPRPPLILGFVLGALIERYMFISFSRYGFDWLSRPIVIALFVLIAVIMAGPFRRYFKEMGGVGHALRNAGKPKVAPQDLFYVFVIGIVGYMVITAMSWPWGAKVGPMIIGISVLAFSTISLVNQIFLRTAAASRSGEPSIHLDMGGDYGEMPQRTLLIRAGMFLGYLVLFMGLMATIGLLPTIPLFILIYMRLEGRESWKIVAGYVVVLTLLIYVIFDRLLTIPWPPTLIGQWFPALTVIPSV